MQAIAGVTIVAICTVLKAPLDGLAGTPLPPYLTMFPAVIGVALIAGAAGGLLAVAATALISGILWFPPFGELKLPTPHGLISIALYVGISGFLAVIIGRAQHYRHRLARQTAFLMTLLDTTKAAIAVVEGPELRFRLANRAFQALRPGRPMIGRRYREVFPRVAEMGMERDLERVRESGTPIEALGYAIPLSTAADAAFDHQLIRLSAVKGDAPAVLMVAWDATAHARAQRALEESEDRLSELAESMPHLVWRSREDGRVDYYNGRLAQYVGAERLASGDWSWEGLVHPDDLAPTAEAWRAAAGKGVDYQTLHRLRMADGSWHWHISRARPVRNSEGTLHWYGTATDIHDRMEAEEKVRILLAEVNHRAKNMLALVQAVARQTVRGDPQDFLGRFERRIQALAASQDLLVNSGWEGIDLADLAGAQLALFADLIGTRIRLDGPQVALRSAAAQSLGMALHELATNAGKYGALSNDDGTVDVRWRIGGNGTASLEIVWTERGGPPVEPPTRKGFGTVVIGRMVEEAVGGKVEIRHDAEGIVWRLVCSGDLALGGDDAVASLAAPPASAAVPRPAVLVVEDEALVALELADALANAGFTVVGPAASVRQAIELIDCDGCEAAVLDVNLGAETSEPVAERLAADGVPFVTVSGYARAQRPPIYEDSPFLAKPLVDPGLVVAAIRATLDAGSAPVPGAVAQANLRDTALRAVPGPH